MVQEANTTSCRIVPQAECAAKNPKYAKLRPYHLPKIEPGSMVMIYVEARGFPSKCPEEVWVIVTGVKKSHITGVVDTKTERANFHGLKYGDKVTFRKGDVVNLMLAIKATV